jgi:hypothetical protein
MGYSWGQWWLAFPLCALGGTQAEMKGGTWKPPAGCELALGLKKHSEYSAKKSQGHWCSIASLFSLLGIWGYTLIPACSQLWPLRCEWKEGLSPLG